MFKEGFMENDQKWWNNYEVQGQPSFVLDPPLIVEDWKGVRANLGSEICGPRRVSWKMFKNDRITMKFKDSQALCWPRSWKPLKEDLKIWNEEMFRDQNIKGFWPISLIVEDFWSILDMVFIINESLDSRLLSYFWCHLQAWQRRNMIR